MSYLRAIYNDYSHCCNAFIDGIRLLEERAVIEASQCFQQACALTSPSDPGFYKYLSYHGLALVLRGDDSGLELCRRAIQCAPADGDMYLNLVRVESFYRHRKQAVMALQQGLDRDVIHQGLQLMQKKLGIRKKQPVAFLSRQHPLNQHIGRLMRRRRSLQT